jgi:hypothetical protein
MNTCLSFTEIVARNHAPVAEMQRLGARYADQKAPGASEVFRRQARLVESVLVQTYGLAASVARKAEALEEAAAVWRETSLLCNGVLAALSELRHRYPDCGAPQLYDLALDYKLSADKRFKEVQEEIACQKHPLPPGLLPALS